MKSKITPILLVSFCLLSILSFSVDPKWISAMTLSPSSPSAGDTVTFTATFKEGRGDVNNLKIVGRIDGSPVWKKVYPVLRDQQTFNVSFTWVATIGTHKAVLMIDPQENVDDTNRDNNKTSIVFAIKDSRPNLKIIDVSWNPQLLKADILVNILFKVKNFGTNKAERSRFDIKVDNVVVKTFNVDALPGMAQGSLNFPWKVKCGSKVTFIVDAGNVIDESNEGDNTWEKKFGCIKLPTDGMVVKGEIARKPGPDLIAKMSTTPESPILGKPASVIARVENNGTEDSVPCTTTIYISNEASASYKVPAIRPGSHYSIYHKIIFKKHGKYDTTALADHYNDVKESYENNNSAKNLSFNVIAPDLVFQNLNVSDTHVDTLEKIVWSGEVLNSGDAYAGPFNIELLWEKCKGVASARKIERVKNGLKPGVVYKFSFSHRYVCVGFKDCSVVVDKENEVIEISESNNVGWEYLTILVGRFVM